MVLSIIYKNAPPHVFADMCKFYDAITLLKKYMGEI